VEVKVWDEHHKKHIREEKDSDDMSDAMDVSQEELSLIKNDIRTIKSILRSMR